MATLAPRPSLGTERLVSERRRFDRSLDGFFKRVVLTAFVLILRGGTGIPIAAAFSGGSESYIGPIGEEAKENAAV